MKKKVIAAALAVCMMTTLAIGMTLAYFTDTKDTKNTFTVGNVTIKLTEPGWEASGKVDGKTVYAGEPLAKDPTVENTGSNPCFVRIKVEGLNSLGQDLPITYRTLWRDGKLGTDWVDGGDGYFYYTKILEANRPEKEDDLRIKTPALFDQIVMPTGLTNGDGWSQKLVTVTAQAVQAQGAKPSWDAVKTMDIDAIQLWFNTCIPPTAP